MGEKMGEKKWEKKVFTILYDSTLASEMLSTFSTLKWKGGGGGGGREGEEEEEDYEKEKERVPCRRRKKWGMEK